MRRLGHEKKEEKKKRFMGATNPDFPFWDVCFVVVVVFFFM